MYWRLTSTTSWRRHVWATEQILPSFSLTWSEAENVFRQHSTGHFSCGPGNGAHGSGGIPYIHAVDCGVCTNIGMVDVCGPWTGAWEWWDPVTDSHNNACRVVRRRVRTKWLMTRSGSTSSAAMQLKRHVSVRIFLSSNRTSDLDYVLFLFLFERSFAVWANTCSFFAGGLVVSRCSIRTLTLSVHEDIASVIQADVYL